MRLSVEEIKAAILHPDLEVREAAVFYFSKSHSDDPAVMPLVIEAVKRYGLDAFFTYSFLIGLSHTTESVAWLIHQIEHANYSPHEYEEHVAAAFRMALLRCKPELLKHHENAIQAMVKLDEATRNEIKDRIEVGSMTGEIIWAALHDFCESMDDDESFSSDNYDHARYLANALASYGEQYRSRILEYLDTPGDAIGWLEVFAVIAAGAMRLEAAIPWLVDTLEDLDTYACQEAHSALEKIGGDSVVQALVERYSSEGELNIAVVAILENIHSDRSVEACLGLLADEKDEFLRGFILEALLVNFESAAIEPARQHVLTCEKSPNVLEVRMALLVACRLLNERFPEFDAWLEDSKHDTEFRKEWYKDHPLRKIADLVESDDDDFDDDFDGFGGDEPTDVEETPPTTIRRGERVGRNDPCPCGSGKKYKKCCLGKATIIDETDSGHASALGTLQAGRTAQKYPIGTVALYGPNDKTTTKIAASVIKREGAEPIVERWVGTNVLSNPKVQRQIKSLFDRHRVKNVVQTDGNIGCPHEEGLDFPVGEDCPFCPHWAGKQGTGRRE
jgi:hypothetical protein